MATVRIEPRLHATLQALSADEKRPIGQVIEDAIDRYQREKFWTAMHEGFTRLRSNVDAWDEYQAESALWDSVSGDGLEEEAPYVTGEETGDGLAATAESR